MVTLTPPGCSATAAKKLWKNRLFQGLNVNELSSPVTRKSFQNQTELSRFSVSPIPFIPSPLILRLLIQLVTVQVKAFEVWSKIPPRLQSGGTEGTLPFVLFLVANVVAPSQPSSSSKPEAKMQIALELGWYFSCWIMTNPKGWLMLNDFVPSAHMAIASQILLPQFPGLNRHLDLNHLYKKYCWVHLHHHSRGKKKLPGSCLTASAYEPLMCFDFFSLPVSLEPWVNWKAPCH